MSSSTAGDPVSTQGDRAGIVRLSVASAFTALLTVYLGSGPGREPSIDPDAWHQMALIREALSLGHLPRTDPFAFTSTVEPLVHHEWGMGVILYWIGTTFGAFGLAVLRDALAIGIGVGCVLCARRRGADHPVLWTTLPVAILLVWIGFSTVRAQMFTLFFLAWLLWLLELDRAGHRWWILPWLAVHVVWVNMHAGFVVGMIAFGLYTLEQAVRRRPVGRLLLAAVAMLALVAFNPYGLDHYAYLWHGLRLERAFVYEWQPLWLAWWPLIVTFGVSVLLGGYALVRTREERGRILEMLFLFAAAYAAIRHHRHLSIYAVAWACYIPALLQSTPLGSLLDRLVNPEKRAVAAGLTAAAVAAVAFYGTQKTWVPTMPANPGDHPSLLYPVGAVDYLDGVGFQGSLITPFEVGAFVTWRLHPHVLVSLDGRFEVAYEPGLLEEHLAFFRAGSGWDTFLDRLAPDAVLVRADAPVAGALSQRDDWADAYVDDAYRIYVSDMGDPDTVDRRGERLAGSFP